MHGYHFTHHELTDKQVVIHDTFREKKTGMSDIGYRFVWDCFNDVARDHNIKLPYHWSTFPPLNTLPKRALRRADAFIMEPLGPVVYVDMAFDINLHGDMHYHSSDYLYLESWRMQARKFFMVQGSAKQVVENKYTIHRLGIMCEKWRAIKARKYDNEDQA